MKPEIITLHKYFIHANRMRTLFDEKLKSNIEKTHTEINPEELMYMHLWYGCLYVVVEGWQDLRLSDPAIDDLLLSSNVDLLRGCRNDVFHFQRDYINARTVKFFEGEGTADWVRDLNQKFGGWFLVQLRA